MRVLEKYVGFKQVRVEGKTLQTDGMELAKAQHLQVHGLLRANRHYSVAEVEGEWARKQEKDLKCVVNNLLQCPSWVSVNTLPETFLVILNRRILRLNIFGKLQRFIIHISILAALKSSTVKKPTSLNLTWCFQNTFGDKFILGEQKAYWYFVEY